MSPSYSAKCDVSFSHSFSRHPEEIIADRTSLLAIVYQHLKRMNYMDVAGLETIHVTINDAVLHTLKTVSKRGLFRADGMFSLF